MPNFNLSEFRTFLNDDSDGHRLAEYLQQKLGSRGNRQRRRVFADYEPENLSLTVRVEKAITPIANTTTNRTRNASGSGTRSAPTSPIMPRVPLSPAANQRSQHLSTRKSGGVTSDMLRRYSIKRRASIASGRRTLLQEFESTVSSNEFSPKICSTPASTRTEIIISPAAGKQALMSTSDDKLIESLQRKDDELLAMLDDPIVNCEKENINQDGTLHATLNRNTTHSKTKQTHLNARKRESIHNSEKNISAETAVGNEVAAVDAHQKTQRLLLSNDALEILPQIQLDEAVHCEQYVAEALADVAQSPMRFSKCTATPEVDVIIPETQEMLIEQEPLIYRNSNAAAKVPLQQTFNEAKFVMPNQLTHVVAAINNETYTTAPATKNLSKSERTSMRKEGVIEFVALNNESLHASSRNGDRLCDNNADEKEEVENYTIPEVTSLCAPLNLASSATNKSTANSRLSNQQKQTRRQKSTKVQMEASNTEDSLLKAGFGPPRAHAVNLRRRSGRLTTQRRKVQPLNKAPSTPINGEKYAHELKTQLARLSNREILDLRKRNSFGKIFPLRGRKSKDPTLHEEQLQLEEEIQMEILRRNLLGNSEGLEDCAVQSTNEMVNNAQQQQPQQTSDEGIFAELLPAPEAFKDTSSYNSSLIDDHSCDRVSFMPPPTRRGSADSNRSNRSKRTKNRVPDIVQSYLNITKELSKSKKNKNGTKRSLLSTEQGIEKTPEKLRKSNELLPERNEVAPIAALTLPTATPICSDADEATSHVCLRASPVEPSTPHHSIEIPNESLPTVLPPPSQFSSNVDNDTNADNVFKMPTNPAPKAKHKVGRPKKSTTSNAPMTLAAENTAKQKVGRPRKSTTRNAPITLPAENAAHDAVGNEEANNSLTLRRSKRGHVPIKNTWSFQRKDAATPFQLMYEQVLMRNIKNAENMLLKSKATSNQRRKAATSTVSETTLPIASSTANSYSAASSTTKARATLQTKKTVKQNKQSGVTRSLLGDTNCSSASSNAPSTRRDLSPIYEPPEEAEENAGTVETPKKKSRKAEKVKNKNTQKNVPKKADVTLAPPIPSVNHLNSVFDQLRCASICLDDEEQVHDVDNTTTRPTATTTKLSNATNNCSSDSVVKKLRVRLRRCDLTATPTARPTLSSSQKNAEKPTSAISSSNTTVSSTDQAPIVDLCEWLKGICDMQPSTTTAQIFNEMRCSTAGNLVFTDLGGIDYAFYETNDAASLGYLRFKPKQFKPSKRAGKYHLHFIIISSVFKICTNNEAALFNIGDMVAINKGKRYTIENVGEDVGLLMVIKK